MAASFRWWNVHDWHVLLRRQDRLYGLSLAMMIALVPVAYFTLSWVWVALAVALPALWIGQALMSLRQIRSHAARAEEANRRLTTA